MEGVGGEFLDGDECAGGEAGLVDKAKAAVADDEVRGEVIGGSCELLHGDLEVGVEGPAGVDDGDRIGRVAVRVGDGSGSGSVSGGVGAGLGGVAVLADEDDGAEDEADDEEAGDGGQDGCEGVIHGHGGVQRERVVTEEKEKKKEEKRERNVLCFVASRKV